MPPPICKTDLSSQVKGMLPIAYVAGAAASGANTDITSITAADKGGQVFNVKAYNAVGDGAADDTAAIQAAIDAVPAVGGIVFLPPGTYKITATLTIAKSGLRLSGAQIGATTLSTAYVGGPTILLDGPNSLGGVGSNNIIEHLSIVGPFNAAASNFGIAVDTQNSGVIRNVAVTQTANGIKVTGGTFRFFILDSNVSYIPGAGVGILQEDAADLFIQRVHMANNAPALAGINITGSGGTWIDACDITISGHGLKVNPPAGKSAGGLWVTSTAFDTNPANGIYIVPAGGGKAHAMFFLNNSGASSGDSGVVIDGRDGPVSEIYFIGHRFISNQTYGLRILSATNVVISDSEFASNGIQTPGEFPAMLLEGVSHISLVGNRIGEAPYYFVPDVHPGYAIQLTGVNDYLLVKDNRATDLAHTFVIGLGNAGQNSVFRDNLPDSTAVSTVASAANLLLGDATGEMFQVSGTTSIATITPAWKGRELTLIFTDAAPGGVTTGGNIARAQAAAQNQAIRLTFDGTSWF